ncbi:DUF6773 family protein [Bacillus piscicola]|uniref:DUF6773 family protein n=1 Tax=Bacillus piscicola TaxID=1632684 RepID=UPI001F08AEBA|nr:DUF6773 family protein [Bacillus piscicola]
MKERDERVTNMQNQIYREMYWVVFAVVTASAVIKFILYGVEFRNVATEFVILIAQGIYYSVRSSQLGLFSAEVEMHDRKKKIPMWKKQLLIGLFLGVGMALYMGIHSAVMYADGTRQSFYYFISVFGVALLIYVPFLAAVMGISYYTAKRQSDKAMKKELDDCDETW